MPKVSHCTVPLKGRISNWRSLAEDLREMLSRLGYRRLRIRVHSDSVEVTGVRGWRALDLLSRLLPVVEWLPFGTQTGARLRARPSLNEHDDRILLDIRCLPTRLRGDERDWSHALEKDGESIGEHLRARRRLREILVALDDAGRLAPAEGLGSLR